MQGGYKCFEPLGCTIIITMSLPGTFTEKGTYVPKRRSFLNDEKERNKQNREQFAKQLIAK